MDGSQAKTAAEAQAQVLTNLPSFAAWREFAGLLNGYAVAEDLGLNFHEWGAEQEKCWQDTRRWKLDVLHLRLMLFYVFRADYFTGWTYTEHDEIADSLLQALSEQSGLPYGGNVSQK